MLGCEQGLGRLLERRTRTQSPLTRRANTLTLAFPIPKTTLGSQEMFKWSKYLPVIFFCSENSLSLSLSKLVCFIHTFAWTSSVTLFPHFNSKFQRIEIRQKNPMFLKNFQTFNPIFYWKDWISIIIAEMKKKHFTSAEVITLEELKRCEALSELQVVKRGCRLSVMPVTPAQWDAVMQLRNGGPLT